MPGVTHSSGFTSWLEPEGVGVGGLHRSGIADVSKAGSTAWPTCCMVLLDVDMYPERHVHSHIQPERSANVGLGPRRQASGTVMGGSFL